MGQKSGCVPFISVIKSHGAVWHHNGTENEKDTVTKLDEFGHLKQQHKEQCSVQ